MSDRWLALIIVGVLIVLAAGFVMAIVESTRE